MFVPDETLLRVAHEHDRRCRGRVGARRRARLAEHADVAAAHGRRGLAAGDGRRERAAVHELGVELHKRLGTFAGHLAQARALARRRGRRLQRGGRLVRVPRARPGARARGARRHRRGRRLRRQIERQRARSVDRRATTRRSSSFRATRTPREPRWNTRDAPQSFLRVRAIHRDPREHSKTVTDVRNVIVIGGGPAGLHGRAVRGAREPRAARDRGLQLGRPADDHERRRELPGLRRRRPRARR